MMCKEMKEDLKRMRSLRDGGRKESENSGNSALGLRDGGVNHSKEWVIDSGYSIHKSFEKEKQFLSLKCVMKALLLY